MAPVIRKVAIAISITIAIVCTLIGCTRATPYKDSVSIQVQLSGSDPVIAAAGDIACNAAVITHRLNIRNANTCQMQSTADLLLMTDLAAVLPLGDLQYDSGSLADFQQSYDLTWGRVKDITHPVVGNHEYGTPGAAGYFSYFGSAAGEPGKGYYSYDIGNWHLIALNSNCQYVGGCGVGSPQEQWLKEDLATHPAQCTLAYWHHPRFSSGHHGNDAASDAFWRALYAAGADIVLNGHDHTYERLSPQTPDGEADQDYGIREFVIGTGGKSHYPFAQSLANSEVRNADTYGVLMLALHPDRYEWAFVPEAGKSFTDSGSALCHSIDN